MKNPPKNAGKKNEFKFKVLIPFVDIVFFGKGWISSHLHLCSTIFTDLR